jgi:Transposase
MPCVSKRLRWSCALTVWSVMESLVGSLRLSKSASTGATFVTAVEDHGGEQTLIDDFDFYVGIDLAVEKHQACVVNRTGKVVGELAFEHSGAGLIDFIHSLEKLSCSLATRVGIVLETPRGPVVECVLERGYSVFSINPKQLDRFRDRHTVAGAKTIDETPLYSPILFGRICRYSGDYSRRVHKLSVCESSPGLKMIWLKTIIGSSISGANSYIVTFPSCSRSALLRKTRGYGI